MRFPPKSQIAGMHLTHSLLPQWREMNCALKSSTQCTFDVYFRTILLWLKVSLPVLPRPLLSVKGCYGCLPWSCATNTWSEESHPWVLKTRPRECVLPSHATLKDQTCLLDDKLLATGARSFSTNSTAMENIFQESEKETLFIPATVLSVGAGPASNQVLPDIPKAWTHIWRRQESFPSEQECANEQFFFL